MSRFTSLSLLALPLLASAALVPTGPGPNDVFKEGEQCTVSWTADTTGAWKTAFIELMTGQNNPMVHLTTVAQIDGTDPKNTSLSWTCPPVTPNSAIYFYQFTAAGQQTTWTTRWTIAGANGETTPPANANQPNGDPVPWGIGSFVAPFKGTPPPPTAPAGQSDASQGGAPVNATGSGLPPTTSSAAGNATNTPTSASVAPTLSNANASGISTVASGPTPSASTTGGNSTTTGGHNAAAASSAFSSAGVFVTVASVALAALAF